MDYALPVGRLFGIPIRLHIIFILLFALLVGQEFASSGAALALEFTLKFSLLFLFVLLHELGHSVVAQRFGIHVLDITLWPLGGLARLSFIPQSPRVEFAVAVAGPLVNFALAGVCVILGSLTGDGFGIGLDSWFGFAFWTNCAMGGFNLVPAFPLDGGRVFRALLARQLPWIEATRVAVRVARVLACVLLLIAVAAPQAFGLALIAIFVFVSAGSELRAAEAREYDRLARAFDAFDVGRAPRP
jgi:Zn-dependent protease